MNRNPLNALCLALCLGSIAPVALAATDMNNSNRIPSQQLPGTGTIDRNGPSGSGTPADGLGTGNTRDNGIDNSGGNGNRNGVGNPGAGRTTPDVGNPGGPRRTPDAGNPGTGRGSPATPGSSGGS